jgi:hypothetical protein
MKTTKKISELKEWDKNPRSIKVKDFSRLKEQIRRLGKYKPLLITKDGTVIGGNMRLKALKELSIKEVAVTIIEFHKNEKGFYATIEGDQEGSGIFKSAEDGMMEYALSDNDRAGFYDVDLLANSVPEFDIDWNAYSVDIGSPMSIGDLLGEGGSSLMPEIDLTDGIDTEKKCPKCGYEW